MIFLTGTKCKIRVIYVRFICKRKRGLKMDTLLDFWNCTWKCATLIVLWYFTVIVTNPKIPPRLLFRHILPVLRSNSRSIVAIKLTIQTPSTFSFHPLYPRSCQHQNNKNSNYFPFVKFHILYLSLNGFFTETVQISLAFLSDPSPIIGYACH